MGLITGIVLIILGTLAASSFIVARRPEAAGLIATLSRYQGWLGFVFCLWGIWTTIHAVMNLSWLGSTPGNSQVFCAARRDVHV